MGRKWDAFPTISYPSFIPDNLPDIWHNPDYPGIIPTLLFRIRSSKGSIYGNCSGAILIQTLSYLSCISCDAQSGFLYYLNLVVPFLLVLLTDKFNPKAYFVYGMEFVLLQMVPIAREQIPARLLALLYGYSFVTLALFFIPR